MTLLQDPTWLDCPALWGYISSTAFSLASKPRSYLLPTRLYNVRLDFSKQVASHRNSILAPLDIDELLPSQAFE
jgi:hypothetical protein